MKKGDVKNLISAIGMEKIAYFYSNADETYLSNGYFILKTRDKKIAQYIIDSVNNRKRKPEWKELEKLSELMGESENSELCSDIEEKEILKDGRKVLCLKQNNYSVWINAKYVIPNTDFYTIGKIKPVFQFYGRLDNPEATLMILPINHS